MNTKNMHEAILVVDDDTNHRTILSRLLVNEGFSVHAVDSATECLQSLESHKPTLILMDVQMPDMLGTDLCVQIKNDSRFEDVIIILISGFKITPEDQAYGLEIGADDYIARPFVKRELIARINSLIRLKETVGRRRKNEPYSAFSQKNTEQTAAVFAQTSLMIGYPIEFKKLQHQYSEILHTALEQRIYKSEGDVSKQTKQLAEELGFFKANARDVIDIHKKALNKLPTHDSAQKYYFIKEESKILLVELMGYLVNYYRNLH
jgi:DNA-binding response OmpR family regulator